MVRLVVLLSEQCRSWIKIWTREVEHMGQKDIMNAKRAEFLQKFQEKYAVCNCKGLLKHDISKPEEMQKILDEGLLFDFCPEVVKDSITILKEIF